MRRAQDSSFLVSSDLVLGVWLDALSGLGDLDALRRMIVCW